MKRGRIVIVLAVIGGSLIWVAANGLTGNLVYYKTPTEILNQGATAVGERVRVGGLVVPGSVQDGAGTVRFVITDGTTSLTVLNTGSVPALFRDGQGVVVEGTYESDGAFHSDTVLVKHNGVYRPPPAGETPHSADISGGG
jgi:cytochrome c-type biogenesis protein CcmE